MIHHEIETLIEEMVVSDKTRVLSDESLQILTKALDIQKIEDVLDMPYPSSEHKDTPRVSPPLTLP